MSCRKACIRHCTSPRQLTPPLVTHRKPEDRALVARNVAARLLALHGKLKVEVPVQVDPLDAKGTAVVTSA